MKIVYAIYDSEGTVYSVVDSEDLTHKIIVKIFRERILGLIKALREVKL